MNVMPCNTPIVIGIMGAIGSGKSSVADHLVKGRGFKSLGFADTLKDMTLDVLGLQVQHCYGTQEEKNAPVPGLEPIGVDFAEFGWPWTDRVGEQWSGRYLLEFLGTDVFRAIQPDVWVNAAMRRVKVDQHLYKLHDQAGGGCIRHVFADVRFQNEVDAIYQAGGHMWRTVVTDRAAETTGHVSDPGGTELTFPGPHLYELQATHGRLDLLFNRADNLLANMGG